MELIRLSKSSVGDDEKNALAEVIDHGMLGMGHYVQRFEQQITSFLGTKNEVICVNTGTSALHLALQCLGVGPGDEVLVPTITYVASFQAISATGATPIACDVCLDRVFIDLEDAGRKVTARTKAIMPVHYASSSLGIELVYEFARKHDIRVVEDAAHGFGCFTDKNERVGCSGDIICFSFDGIKNITSGEGGAVVTGDKLLAEKIKDARLLGVEKDTDKRYQGARSWSFDVKNQGFRFHMSNLMAAIGSAQLQKINSFKERRQAIAAQYCKDFDGIGILSLLKLDWNNIIPHIFSLRVLGGHRDGLMARLRELNIESGFHYAPNHLLTMYKFDGYKLKNSEQLADELISLPIHPDLTDEQQKFVISSIRMYCEGKS